MPRRRGDRVRVAVVAADAPGALLRRPDLWLVALRQLRRFAAPGWWRRPPFLPLPAPGLLAFRLETQYGDARARLTGADLVSYLAWCREWQDVGRMRARARRNGRAR